MNHQLLSELDQYLSETTPTKFIKRGNAFAQIELVDTREIKEQQTRLQFDGISISQVQRQEKQQYLLGECYICEGAFREEEYELHIEIPKEVISLKSLELLEYSIDSVAKFISLKLCQ